MDKSKKGTGGVVSSMISKPKKATKTKLFNMRMSDELHESFSNYCYMKGSRMSEVLVEFMKRCVFENEEKIKEFLKLRDGEDQ